MTDEEPLILNRVLMTAPLPFREFAAEGSKGFVVDGSGLPYLVEEMIALSAVQVVIPDNVVAAGFVDTLAAPLKDRVRVVNARRASDATFALCSSIGDEFGITLDRSSVRFAKGVEPGLDNAFVTFWSALPTFLLGMEYEIQVDLSPRRVAQAAQVIREASTSDRTRAIMAAFQGVFATYRPFDLVGLTSASHAPEDQARLLERLVEDETFRQLSASVHSMAMPSRRERAITLARRLAQDVVSKAAFKNLFGVGAKAVEAITHVPLPDREVVGNLIGTSFFPPLVSLAHATERAHRLWKKQEPPFVAPDGWDADSQRTLKPHNTRLHPSADGS